MIDEQALEDIYQIQEDLEDVDYEAAAIYFQMYTVECLLDVQEQLAKIQDILSDR